ncbi:MAG TPA: tRNA (adenosine(37)-N6)-threonylcarbamoyltransferase complex dimerization subunit type 1 TsaB [Thiomicrospira sp.]|jgi:tRNA threonylcarbamoyladenosine biosynthesis protein TsaB|nr:tRNA (adenosine(37)-N6)-threonylcarbamoyltransferase complex dimerization subunit type 1 TsaB [Thiomicrospira sp.]
MLQDIRPNVLAIETSTQACSVALISKNHEYIRHEILPQKHAHRVLAMVDEVLKEAGIDCSEIDLIAYGEGPGAFTGVRIASGVVQGLALGWDKPVLPVSSLFAMAEGVIQSLSITQATDWVALLDARMGEVYFQKGRYFPKEDCFQVNDPVLVSPADVADLIETSEKVVGVGDTEQEYSELSALFADWYPSLPNAVSIARIAQNHANEAKSLSESVPNPLYLRNHIADTIEERKQKKLAQA